MNQKDLMFKRKKVRDGFHRPGSTKETKCVINHVAMRPNSWGHEQAKALKCWELMKEGKQFITEAKCRFTGLVRDVVCLDDGISYEIETDPVRAQRFRELPNTEVIMVEK